MKTHTHPSDAPRMTSTTLLRRVVAAGALVPLLALAGCSGEAPVTADPTRSGPTATATATATATESAATTTPTAGASTSATSAPAAQGPRIKIPVDVTLKDPILGHEIHATEVVRNMPWPTGHPIAAETFEIVGVHVTVKAGSRYSAEVLPAQLTLKLASGYARQTDEFGPKFAKLLTVAKRGQTRSGWLIYKVDKGMSPLTLMFHRPAYEVSTTDKSIPAKLITVKLTD